MAPDIVHAPAAPLLAPAIAQAPPPPPLALGAPAMATAIMQAPPPPLLDLGTPLMAPVIIVQAPTAPLLAPAPPLLAPGAAPLVGAPLLDLAAAVRCVGDIVEVVAANKAAQTPEAARVEEAQWAQSVEFLARTYGGYPRAKAKTNAVKQRIVIENMDMVLSKTACLEGEFLGSGRMVVDLIPITIPGDTSGVQRNNLRINDTASRYATIRVLQEDMRVWTGRQKRKRDDKGVLQPAEPYSTTRTVDEVLKGSGMGPPSSVQTGLVPRKVVAPKYHMRGPKARDPMQVDFVVRDANGVQTHVFPKLTEDQRDQCYFKELVFEGSRVATYAKEVCTNCEKKDRTLNV